jgi:four helix bundle protein
MGDYRQLSVWKRAHMLALEVFRLTAAFPPSERYGLAAQLRRAATSIASNIAEGCGRHSNRDEIRFFRIARGSVFELEYQLLLSRDVGLLKDEIWKPLDHDCREIGRMLNGLIRYSSTKRPTI